MLLPHELVAKYVAPYMRALVAVRLREEGLGQERIARLLGVTQAMVNRYLSWGRGRALEKLREAGVEPGEALGVAYAAAERLLQGDAAGYLELLTAFANSLLAGGRLCRLHRSRGGAPAGCEICPRLFASGDDTVLLELREALSVFIERAPAELVPNVGSNIVVARSGASSLGDVAGLTGGLVRLSDGRIAVVGEPRYGGSRHTGQVLLLAARRWPGIRAAVVVSPVPGCVEALSSLGYVAAAGPHRGPESLLEYLAAALEDAPAEPVALLSRGGQGLEPVVYVFGRTGLEAVTRALSCVGAERA
jgi:predicted fused transcriptional regulator/phosphomethylpyrimidine kinase/predicted transcriptional regulator